MEASDELFSEYSATPIETAIAGLRERHRLQKPQSQLLQDYQELLDQHYIKESRLAGGARQLLGLAADQGAQVGIVTSASRSHAQQVLEALRVDVDHLVTADDVREPKPAAEPYRVALARAAVPRNHALALEDSPGGVSSAKSAGLRCLLIGQPEYQLCSLAWRSMPSIDSALPLISAFLNGEAVAMPAKRTNIAAGPDLLINLSRDERSRERAVWSTLSEDGDVFDGPLLAVQSIASEDQSNEELRIDCSTTSYRRYIAHRNGIGPRVAPLGVTAISSIGPQLLVGRRSERVTQYPSCWEFAGSGTLPPARRDDPLGHLACELEEETGLDRSQISSAEQIGLIEDLAQDCLDICLRVAFEGAPTFRPATDEYVELKLVSRSDAHRLAAGVNAVPTMPAALALLEAKDEG